MRRRKSYRVQLLLGLGLCALAPLLLGFLCYPLLPPALSGVTTPVPVATFAPTVSASVVNTSPNAASNIELSLSFPAGSTLAIGATFDVPAGWTVASDANVTDGSIVGSIAGSMTVADPVFYACSTGISFDPTASPATDIKLLEATTSTTTKVSGRDTDNNGLPQVVEDSGNGLPKGVVMFPDFLDQGITYKARYFGHTKVAGLSDLYVNILVIELASGGPYRVIPIVNDPTAPPESATSQFCAPQSLTLTLFGTSANNPLTVATEGGQPVYTNPAAGSYTFSAALVSEFDRDNDGKSNGLDICPAIANAGQADADQDYVGDACEQDSVQNFDVDGDGIGNGYDNCIFVANANQTDNDFDDIGDACDPNPTVPDGANYYLTCTDPVGIGQSDPGGATCVSGLQTPTATPGSVGGIAELPEVAGTPLETPDSSDFNAGVLAIVAAAAAVSAIALGGATVALRSRRGRS